ncbi:MAG: hypothetical protein B6I31_04580 [Desulfobacteraceae bacterium 4572_19]|nr:MAG: hypothetical protein B6I31_04580 [Desulfobacteraceae bacterium 4572_19]
MAKEKVKHMTGVLASIFSHSGHISKDDAKEISGLDDNAFERVYAKAANIAQKAITSKGKVLEHFMEEIDEYYKEFEPTLFKNKK